MSITLNIKINPAGTLMVTYADLGFDEVFHGPDVFKSSIVLEQNEYSPKPLLQSQGESQKDEFFYYSINA